MPGWPKQFDKFKTCGISLQIYNTSFCKEEVVVPDLQIFSKIQERLNTAVNSSLSGTITCHKFSGLSSRLSSDIVIRLKGRCGNEQKILLLQDAIPFPAQSSNE